MTTEVPETDPLIFVRFDGLHDDRALRLAARGQSELLERGLADNVPIMGYDQRVFLALRGVAPVGMSMFVYYEYQRELFVVLSYVLPACRRTGVYDFLWRCLVNEARRLGALSIRSVTSYHNAEMRRLAQRQGRREIAVTLEYEVPR